MSLCLHQCACMNWVWFFYLVFLLSMKWMNGWMIDRFNCTGSGVAVPIVSLAWQVFQKVKKWAESR